MAKRADVPDIARDDTRRRPSGARRKAVTLDPRALSDPRRWLVVIGNGMVSQRFCERAAELGLPRTHRIVVFGEEALPAYNRVQLTRVLGGLDPVSLILEPVRWYAEADIDLRLGERVVGIDRARRVLTTQFGDEQPYDELVFATGSYASTPVIPGTNQRGVLSYRSVDDAQRIRARARVLAQERSRVVVIGSGLLGLETGQALAELGCSVTFVEAAPQLLPRQLDAASAGIVALLLRSAGFELCVGQVVERIVLTSEVRRPHLARAGESDDAVPDTRLRVVLGGGAGAIDCGMVVLAAGVKPRDELARASGIACPAPGGISVDSAMMTSDPHVFAIGECARHAGRCPGLVAPGFAMAEVLAERFAGSNVTFTSHEPSTRLEVVQRPIVVIGENRAAGDDVKTVEADDRYRRLVLREGRLVGATAIGDGADLTHLQEAIVLRTKLRRSDFRRIERGVDPWRGLRFPSSAAWPDTATVCECTGVTFGALRRARAEGHCSLEQLCARTGAGSGCGSCRVRVASFAEQGGLGAATCCERCLAVLSLVALIAVPVGVAAGPIAARPSLLSSPRPLDVLFHDHFARQLSGFALAFVCVLTALWIALAKRRATRLQKGTPRARTAHALLGVLCLAGVVAHTGLRPGNGVDLALYVCLLGLILVGAAAALPIASGIGSGPTATALKRRGLRLHVWVAWPAPVLLVAHVVKSYYF